MYYFVVTALDCCCRTHAHRDAEIFSYVVDGWLSHADSMGNKEALPRGSVQYLSAGSGITHSEMNDHDEMTRFLQVWIRYKHLPLRASKLSTALLSAGNDGDGARGKFGRAMLLMYQIAVTKPLLVAAVELLNNTQRTISACCALFRRIGAAWHHSMSSACVHAPAGQTG
jgi:redox-sensitive bicupin YhaK (pirin superfamily)